MTTRAVFWRAACSLGLLLALGAPAVAAPVTETNDRLEVNWATHRIRFFGESSASASDGLKGAEKRAWQDGLSYINDAVRDLNVAENEPYVTNPEKLAEDAREAARHVASATFSYNTTYFANGTVRVHLESALAKAIETTALRFRQKEALEPTMIQHTGVVIEADKATKPRAIYQVVDETGTVLFDVKDMAADAYRRNLMGRWFKKPQAGELSEVVGKSPLRIAAKVDQGRFVVRREDWEGAVNGHKSLLVNGLIAIALP